ncbi:Peptidyl-prolyl cis-trans isomerase PASTICCINO1 [Hibiscus syriacus]|uniref:peptidylprolyl isomerase n=1 Tax=Hibiscus syriacus TaxID=106335 RepID=A0A6A3BXA4_HIBSY|nr:Peptidyl-prolyl cis-trans isomerase PASTICCINO1 [Hibiscus syriacus]
MAIEEDTGQSYLPSKKKSESEDDKRRKKIVPGSLMKALMRPGVVRTLDGVFVDSTRSEYGGKGFPIRNVLGKSKMILGLLEGIPTMLKGEVAMVVCDDLGVLKKVIDEGQGWESPREPYEVKAWISAKTADGKLILSHTEGEPYFFTFGKSEVPKGLELGVGTMARKEKAVIYVTKQYLTPSTLLPEIEGYEEIHFEVELVRFIQVRDVLGDGRLIKRRLQDGKDPGCVAARMMAIFSVRESGEGTINLNANIAPTI